MRVFVYEHGCATGGTGLAASIAIEGRAMLVALLEDFAALGNIDLVTILTPNTSESFSPIAGLDVRGPRDDAFRAAARGADWTLIVAPESNGILHTLASHSLEAGGRLMSCSPETIRLCTDKLALADHLTRMGVATPRTVLFDDRHSPGELNFPIVWKPRDGAGSEATFLVRDAGELGRCASIARAEGWTGQAILQPRVAGTPASVASLSGRSGTQVLLPGRQFLSSDGRFRYKGGSLPLLGPVGQRALRLARKAVDSLGVVTGYLGVDLVMGDAEDGSDDWVIEINPRLTTSYVGLRALAETNLPAAMLALAEGESPPPLSWRRGAVEFRPNGVVRFMHHDKR